MIGLIQKVLIDLVEQEKGIDAVERLRSRADLAPDQTFRIGEVYSDEECLCMFAKAAEILEVDEERLYTLYADRFGRDVHQRFSKWFEMAQTSRQFIEFQTTIHNTFASGVVDLDERQAVKDKFHVETIDDRRIITHYRSPNKLCKLYRALGAWMAEFYGDEIEFQEPRCQLHGDDECEIHVKWTRLGREDGLFDENGLAHGDRSIATRA